jgi:hypothetical protein
MPAHIDRMHVLMMALMRRGMTLPITPLATIWPDLTVVCLFNGLKNSKQDSRLCGPRILIRQIDANIAAPSQNT